MLFFCIILMIFQKSGMYFWDKIGVKSNGKCHPNSKGSFFLTFLMEIGSWAVLEASWRHLVASWQIFWPFWAPKTPPRCAKINQNRPQEPLQRRLEGVSEAPGRFLVAKKHPRAAQNPSDIDFGASGSRFWKFFLRILARFLMDLIHMFYHFSKFSEARF